MSEREREKERPRGGGAGATELKLKAIKVRRCFLYEVNRLEIYDDFYASNY